VISDELVVADAHPLGARPFTRELYVQKFTELADDVVEPVEQQRVLSTVDEIDSAQTQSSWELTRSAVLPHQAVIAGHGRVAPHGPAVGVLGGCVQHGA
jgi:hypothetical protein